MWYLHIRRHFNDVIFFVMMRKQYGRHVNFNYLPLRLNLVLSTELANKMQESLNRHRLQWTYCLNCTDTINIRYFDDVIMTPRRETQMGD